MFDELYDELTCFVGRTMNDFLSYIKLLTFLVLLDGFRDYYLCTYS